MAASTIMDISTVLAKLRQERSRANREKHTAPFKVQMKVAKIPTPVEEYRFAAIAVGWEPNANRATGGMLLRERLNRAKLADWRFDFAWPDRLLAVEIDGAVGFGRHTRVRGYEDDCVKIGEAQILGWTVYRMTGRMVRTGAAINMLMRAFDPGAPPLPRPAGFCDDGLKQPIARLPS